MTIDQKPIMHGRDHSPGGNDPIPDLGGIQFDTYPQAGQWLYVETDGTDTSPSGFGMEFFDDSGNGIDLASHGDITLRATGGGGINITTTGDFLAGPLQQDVGDPTILTGQGITIHNNDSSASLTLESDSDGYYVRLDDAGGISFGSTGWGGDFLRVVVGAGPTIEYHILTGATWVADL
jgi:hypothetical protein